MRVSGQAALTFLLVLGLAAGVALASSDSKPADPGKELKPAPPVQPPTGPAGPQAQDRKPPPQTQAESPWYVQYMPFLLIIGFVVLYIFMGRGKRKQETQRKQMLANLKKGDKITSIGGIIGTVVETREDEVTVKVDDDVRVHFARWAIRGVGEEAKVEKPGDKKR